MWKTDTKEADQFLCLSKLLRPLCIKIPPPNYVFGITCVFESSITSLNLLFFMSTVIYLSPFGFNSQG